MRAHAQYLVDDGDFGSPAAALRSLSVRRLSQPCLLERLADVKKFMHQRPLHIIFANDCPEIGAEKDR
jgi:hypothetical protein